MSDEPHGFIPLKSLREGPPDPARLLAEIRRIYFATKKQTIERDLARAIELLKAMPAEEDRDRARVYMDGLSQMRSDWGRMRPSAKSGRSGGSGKSKWKVKSK
jgi:hypothetical protein